MPAFKDLSITNKLRFIVLIISGLSLLMACGVLGVIEVLNFRQSQINEISILTNIIADRSTASLAFDDSKVAQETLEALKAKPSIISAYIMTRESRLLAQYLRHDIKSDALPDLHETDQYRFTKNSLLGYAPIVLGGRKIGSVYIKSDLSQLYELIGRYLAYVMLVLFSALLVVFLLLSKLQRFISKPILDLAGTAGEIAVHMNFSTKVQKEGEDEIGLLVDAFNSMLDQIRQRDLELIESKNKAEESAQKSRELARETYRTNLTLQKEIGERKRAFQSMLESEKKYRGIFENTQEGIFRATPDNRFLDVNPSMARILGYSSPEELVQSVADIRKLFENEAEQQRLYELLNSQEAVTKFECRLKRKTNTLIWGSIQAIAFRDKDNNLIYMEGLIEDISDRKLAEEALKDAYRQLEKRVEERTAELQQTNEELRSAKEAADDASKAKSVFLANMSHEIRTPMNGVISAAELALAEDMSPKIKHYLKIIHSSGNALLGIINDILDFSKIDAGKLTLEKHPFRIDDVLNNVIAIFAHSAAEKNVELLLDIEPRTPYGVIGDPLRFQQVLMNLMSNAIKFTESGGMICIKINSERKAGNLIMLTCRVNDTGMGMTKQQLEILFQAFTQGDTSTTRKFGGTGLGLCISQQLVNLMSGEMQVKSEYGKGSEFIFTAQFELQPDAQDEIVLPEELKGLQVLIVDDCQESRKILSAIVTSFGFCADTSESGEVAVEFLKALCQKQKTVDLAIIDFKMPGMHGLETAMTIRRSLSLKFPIILMIDFVDKSMLPNTAHAAVSRFLTKPVMASSLFNTILEVFGKKQIIKRVPDTYRVETLEGYRKALEGLKILVVEDNPINQEVTVEILKTVGVIPRLAKDGEEAIEAVMAEPYDAVLMDIQMPKMDGYEATRKIRENNQFQTLPIIAMTASALASDEKKCLDAGMNAYVTKPVQLKKLFQTLIHHALPKNRPVIDEPSDVEEYLRNQQHTLNAPTSLLTSLSGDLNIDQAMLNLKVDDEFYLKIVDAFFKSNVNSINLMKVYASQKKWKKLRALAHEMKGSSSHIGAFKVQAAADNIEKFCMDVNDGNVDTVGLDPLLDALDKELVQTFISIEGFIENRQTMPPGEIEPPIDLSQKERSFYDLLYALKESNPIKISDSLNRLKKNVGSAVIDKIEAKIQHYEYDDAIITLSEVAKDMGLNIAGKEMK
jgi:two-component system, sensor histidine kinase and response regulator